MSLSALRDSIPATRGVIYMNTGFTGPSPEPVLRRMHDVMAKESAVGPASVEGLAQSRAIAEEARGVLGSLLNAEPDEMAVTHGTTEGLHVVIYGLDWQAGDEFVTCSLEHPALATPASVLEERYGVRVKRVDLAADSNAVSALEGIRAAITERTKLVALSHVQFSCGLKLPAKQIVSAAHAAGALVALDGAQTGGQLAIDVKEMDVDFYSISGQKWLLGPNGTGALYMKREHQRRIEPLFTTHALADSRSIPGEGPGGSTMMRFRIASQSPALTAGLSEAVKTLQATGMAEIEAYCHKLGSQLRAGLAAIPGCTLTGPSGPDVSCGLTTVSVAGWEPRQLVDALWQRRRIAVRAVGYPAGIRFSTAPFNTPEEVETALEAMRTLAAETPPPLPEGGPH